MSSTTQKSQESQQALELLFQEKKKVKQLEQQLLLAHKEKALHNEALKNARAAPTTNPTEVSRLQKLITESEQEIALLQGQQKRLKDLYQQQQQENSTLKNKLHSNGNTSDELNAVKLSLENAQQHSRQLERVIQFLRERAEEAQLETKQMVAEFQSSQETIATLKEEVQSAKQEWTDLSIHYNKEKLAKQELLKELQTHQHQSNNLKQQLQEAQSVVANRDQALHDLQYQLGHLRDENRLLGKKTTSLDEYETELATAFKARDDARRRAQAIDGEISLLTEQNRILKEKFDKARLQQESLRDEADQLTEKLSSAQRRVNNFEAEKRELLELSDKQKFAFHELKSSMDTRDKAHQEERLMAKKQQEELQQRLEQHQKQIATLQEELRAIETSKQEFLEREEHYKRSINDLKASLIARENTYQEESVKNKDQLTQLQERLTSAELVYKERDLLQSGLKHHQEEIEKLNQQLAQNEEKHHAAEAQWKQHLLDYETKSLHEQQQLELAHNGMEAEIRSKQAELEAKIQSHQDTLLHKEKQIEELRTRASLQVQEKHTLEEELNKTRRRADDNEAKAQMAHQHLAKKVKETTVMSEKIEEQKHQLLDLQKNIAQTQQRATELQQSLEVHLTEKQKIEEKLQATIVEIEDQTRKWEEKYFHMCQQWERTEAQNNDLRKQKEKLDQLESILSNIGTVMKHSAVATPSQPTESIPPAPTPPPPTPTPPPPHQKESESHAEESAIAPLREESPPSQSPNLFDIYRQQQKPKRNLFDE